MVTRPDWADLSFKVKEPELPTAMGLLASLDPGPSTRYRGRNHYADRLASDVGGASVSYHGLGDAEGTILLTLTGSWWERQPDPSARVAQLVGLEGNVTRFDLAADFEGDDVPRIRDLAAAVRSGEWVTRLRRAHLAEDLTGGAGTIYLGSAASDRRLRLYDLRGPLRVEFRYRDVPAIDLLAETAARGARAAHDAALRARVDFPTVPGWAAMLAAA